MPTPTLRRPALLLLAALLAAPWASAAGPQIESPRATQAVSPDDAFDLSRFWRLLKSAWTKEGCNIDPNGRCVTQKVDTGCNIDPNGRCHP